MPICFLVSLLLISGLARAASQPVVCMSAGQMDSRIRKCTDNSQAAEAAEDCLQENTRAIQEAGPELSRIFGIDFSGNKFVALGKQKKTFHVSESDYQKASAKLDFLIQQATRGLREISSYPPIMLDDESQPVPCYTKNSERVIRSVQDLDQKISELKEAKRATDQLRGIVGVSNQEIENQRAAKGARPGMVRGQQPPEKESGVSGKPDRDSLVTDRQEKMSANLGFSGAGGVIAQLAPGRESGVSRGQAAEVAGKHIVAGSGEPRPWGNGSLRGVERSPLEKSLSGVSAKFQQSELDSALDEFLPTSGINSGTNGAPAAQNAADVVDEAVSSTQIDREITEISLFTRVNRVLRGREESFR